MSGVELARRVCLAKAEIRGALRLIDAMYSIDDNAEITAALERALAMLSGDHLSKRS